MTETQAVEAPAQAEAPTETRSNLGVRQRREAPWSVGPRWPS